MNKETWDSFIERIRWGEEPEFTFRGDIFSISWSQDNQVILGKYKDENNDEFFDNVDEMLKKAKIEGLSLKTAFPEFTDIIG